MGQAGEEPGRVREVKPVARALAALPTGTPHQPDQQLPAREPGTEHRDQWGADDHPMAYAEITCPAVGMASPTPAASWGSSPIETNSVVPIANPPIASANRANPI